MDPSGSKIGIVFNGSPLFTGEAGGGESEIRKWIILKMEMVVLRPVLEHHMSVLVSFW